MARHRADVASVDLTASSLIEVVVQLEERFPTLSELCIRDDQLAPGWLLNINGTNFTRDLTTPLNDNDSVLLIPADAGG